MKHIAVIFYMVLLTLSSVWAQSTTTTTSADSAPEPIIAKAKRAPAQAKITPIGDAIVQGSQLIRIVDSEMGNVCYVAHGRAVNSGVGVYCLPLAKP